MNTKQLLRNSNEDKETQSHKYILCEAKINFTELLFPIFHHIKQYIAALIKRIQMVIENINALHVLILHKSIYFIKVTSINIETRIPKYIFCS